MKRQLLRESGDRKMKDYLRFFGRVMLIIIGALLATDLLFAAGFIYETRYKVHDVEVYESENQNYQVILQEIGEPAWPFGPATARVTVVRKKENGRKEVIERFTEKIDNDGGRLDGFWNCRVSWGEGQVTVMLSGESFLKAYEVRLE